jgi:hypothetical protein
VAVVVVVCDPCEIYVFGFCKFTEVDNLLYIDISWYKFNSICQGLFTSLSITVSAFK